MIRSQSGHSITSRIQRLCKMLPGKVPGMGMLKSVIFLTELYPT